MVCARSDKARASGAILAQLLNVPDTAISKVWVMLEAARLTRLVLVACEAVEFTPKRDRTAELSYNGVMASTAKNADLIAAIRKVIGRLDHVIDEREAGVVASIPPSHEGTHRHTLQVMTCASLPELLLTRSTLLQLLSDLGDEAPDLRGN